MLLSKLPPPRIAEPAAAETAAVFAEAANFAVAGARVSHRSTLSCRCRRNADAAAVKLPNAEVALEDEDEEFQLKCADVAEMLRRLPLLLPPMPPMLPMLPSLRCHCGTLAEAAIR